jgi:hypothetical protein
MHPGDPQPVARLLGPTAVGVEHINLSVPSLTSGQKQDYISADARLPVADNLRQPLQTRFSHPVFPLLDYQKIVLQGMVFTEFDQHEKVKKSTCRKNAMKKPALTSGGLELFS